MEAAHQDSAFDANIPGRMIVDSSPVAAMSRSISACSAAIGFGCRKNGCGVRCGAERQKIAGGRTALDVRSEAIADADADQAFAGLRHGEGGC
ncbi:hypothetical protein Acsp02_61340 [Actinoplanes sp. NBRC 103695]|nr:hypothetical protein Acsp02_61340 [Actinoplanes sp. NBRC 103695]